MNEFWGKKEKRLWRKFVKKLVDVISKKTILLIDHFIYILILFSLTPDDRARDLQKKYLKITRSYRKYTSSSFVEKSWENTFKI